MGSDSAKSIAVTDKKITSVIFFLKTQVKIYCTRFKNESKVFRIASNGHGSKIISVNKKINNAFLKLISMNQNFKHI